MERILDIALAKSMEIDLKDKEIFKFKFLDICKCIEMLDFS